MKRFLLMFLLLTTTLEAREMAYTIALRKAKQYCGPTAMLRQELDTFDSGRWRKMVVQLPFGFATVRGTGTTWDEAIADAAKHCQVAARAGKPQ